MHVIYCLLGPQEWQGRCVTHVPAGMEVVEAAVSLTEAGRHGALDSSLALTSTALSGSPYESVLLALLEGLRYMPLPLATWPCPCSPLPLALTLAFPFC